jgi:hypothetical protein
MRANAGLKNRTTPLGIRESLETHFKRYDDLKNAFEISAAAPWRSDLVLTNPPFSQKTGVSPTLLSNVN